MEVLGDLLQTFTAESSRFFFNSMALNSQARLENKKLPPASHHYHRRSKFTEKVSNTLII
ncbi:MAG: hypothetical protein Q4E24_11665 [bacterium]|nr:hypothetical protein [bacterium]